MRKASSKNIHTQKGLRLALLFCILVIGIIAFSALIRTAVAVKSSAFGGTRYNIFTSGDTPQVVSFAENSGEEKKIRIVSLEDKEGGDIAIPVNARIENLEKLTSENLKSRFMPGLFKRSSTIPFIDKLKIGIVVARTDSDDIEVVSSSDYNKAELEGMFMDLGLSREAKSIQIINASGVAGLGNRLANVISNLGPNVVLVTGEDKIQEESIMQYKEDSLTADYLLSYLGIRGQKKEFESVADVIIILGEDAKDSDKF